MMNRVGPQQNDRRGMALPLVLVCIVLAMALGAALTRSIMLQHRQSRLSVQQHQAAWLAESGIQRAAAQLKANPHYSGEVWKVPAEVLGGSDGGQVVVQVERGEQSGTVVVEAIYPDHPRHRIVERREVSLPVTPAGGAVDDAEESQQ